MRAVPLAVLIAACSATNDPDAQRSDVTSRPDAPETRETDCTNGNDDDADAATDCEDVDCQLDPACRR